MTKVAEHDRAIAEGNRKCEHGCQQVSYSEMIKAFIALTQIGRVITDAMCRRQQFDVKVKRQGQRAEEAGLSDLEIESGLEFVVKVHPKT